MRIQSITLNGFKSYAKSMTLENLDNSFNAITGYNGSGKSNILDGIIFVLGLHTLGMVNFLFLQKLINLLGKSSEFQRACLQKW